MTSGALHDLFQDMYQYSDPYGREGALSQPKPPPSTAPPAPSTHSSYTPLQPSPYPAGGGGVGGPSFGQYGSQHYGTGPGSYHPGGIGAGLTPAPGGIGAGLTPAPAPPSYTDVQTHRDHVAYPYQPSQPSPGYPHQPLSGAATYPYQYPHSGSSSTSELSDVSSGFGTSDGKLAGTSPAIARPMMTSPSSGGTTRPYASGSSVDSSSGFGSYSCEAPDQAESAYRAQAPAAGRQDSYPAPPPPLSQYEASVNHSGEPRPYVDDPNPSKSPPNPEPLTAPPPPPVAAAAVAPSPPPPPPPPPPPLPPPKSWKAEQANTETHQPTRLEQQISNMSVGSDYGRQNSYPSPPVPQSPSHPPGAPAPPAPGPYYGAPKAPASPITPPAPRPQPVIPDAVLNMAAKGEPDKKPWSYAPDMESIKEQRDKVRRRTPFGGMPRYQQMLNLPKFEDSPRPRGRTPQTPPTPGHQQAPTTPDYEPGPGEATVAHVQYNSPLDLYSENNVAEAFTGQTDGLVTGVGGLKKDQGKDITQSPVYKMVHGLDGEKSKPRRGVADEGKRRAGCESSTGASGYTATKHGSPFKAPKGPAEDDEITFSGVLDRSEIPSKSFHKLQNMTAGSEIDTTSIRQNISGENVPISQPRRQRRHRPEPQPEEPEQNPDDIVDISYVGSNIPSRSFKVLQHAVGEHEMNQPDKEKGEAEPEWAKKRRAKLARKQKGRANQFDEDKYLGVEKQGTGI
ncbi:hypothetical protein LSH36_165g01052 [Paralvinella palmiformis]|uniref:Zasp-like motif domain-containing protein n=1 Tax=Paralvinella palmiformis TaxID=53620 RepID=A0AAD9JU60_9ANNE|nr:hypothetical protein LSH36_165g01052 [Paralvinella palmiformis]